MVSEALDWPADPNDPFYRLPTLHDFRDDREGLEKLVLAALCWWSKPRLIAEAVGMLVPEDFRRSAYRMMFEAACAAHLDREPVTTASIVERVDLDVVGGLSTVLDVTAPEFPGGQAEVYAALLAEWGRRERMMQVVKGLPDRVKDDTLDVDTVAAEMQRHLPDRAYGIDRVGDVKDAVVDRIAGVLESGVQPGWPRFGSIYRVAPGVLTVVTGIAGSGKSTLVDCMMLHLAAKHGMRFALFSPESAPTENHVAKLMRMRLGVPTRHGSDRLEAEMKWVGEHFEWINSTEGVGVAEILRRADVIHRRDPIHGLVIDPWNEVDRDADRESEHLRISEALTKIRRWGRRRQLHVWIVAHPTKLPRKQEGGYDPPTLYDVSGSATFRDKADVGIVVHRKNPTDPRGATEVSVVKVRESRYGRLGKVLMAFERETETYEETGVAL